MIDYFYYFLIYSFMGWVMETVLCSVREKRFVHRGFLNGPICPIYGVGMVLIIFFLSPFINNIIVLFFLGMIFSSILEYIVGYVLEKLFYTRWWDYTKEKFNLNGYICLKTSLAWGILCIIMMRVVQPVVVDVQGMIDPKVLNPMLGIVFVALVVDLGFTLTSLTNFRLEIESIHKLQDKLLEESKVAEHLKSIYESFEENKINLKEYLASLKDLAPFSDAKYAKHIKRLNKDRKINKPQINRLLKNYRLKIKDNSTQIIKDKNLKDN
ncbi:MAG: putative ABC transporter permease [Erysipelotrichales bacterium]